MVGGILRDKFGVGISSVQDGHLNHPVKFTIVGINAVDYDKGMKLTWHHIARERKIFFAEPKEQPYTPWATDLDSGYPARKTHCGGREQKHRRKHNPDDEVDLAGASDSDMELEAKH